MEETEKKKDKPVDEKFPPNRYTDVKPLAKRKEDAEKDGGDVKKGHVLEKKRTLGERIADNFLASSGGEIKEHILFDWLIPGIKNVVEDIVHMILFGDSAPDSRLVRSRGESRMQTVNYNTIYNNKRRATDEYIPRKASRQPELIFTRRSDAEQVLNGMLEYIDDYGRATMKNFYNIVFEVSEGEIYVPTDFQMTRLGWYDLSQATIVKVREGYLLRMPRAEGI